MIGAVVGFLLAAGILSALDPGAVRRRLEQLARRPQAPWALGLRGVAIATLGIIVLLFPGPPCGPSPTSWAPPWSSSEARSC